MGERHGGDRLGERADLVHLHEDAVGDALGDAAGEPLRVGDEQVVAHELHLVAEFLADQLPALPVVLRAAVFDRHDRVAAGEARKEVDHAGRVERLALDRVDAGLGVEEFRRGDVEPDEHLLARLVAGIRDRREDHLEGLGAGADVRSKAPLVAHGRGELLVLEHFLQGVERLNAGAEGVVEGVEAQRHHHEFLHVERVVGMRAAVDDVHHRGGQQAGGRATEIAIERLAAVLGSGVGHRHRDAEDGVGAEIFLVGRAVEFQHHLVDGGLVERVAALQFLRDPRVDVLDGLEHALAEVDTLVAVTLLPGLVGTRARARRHGRASKRTIGEADVDLDRGVAAAVENLAGVDVDDRGHGGGAFWGGWAGKSVEGLPVRGNCASGGPPRKGDWRHHGSSGL